MTKQKSFLSKRTDISKYLVHLTKDTKDGNTAKENFLIITVIFSPKLRSETLEIQKKFHVVCFTETPLEKLHLLTNIPDSQVNLKPYGIYV